MKILIVDDDEIALDVLQHALAPEGHQVRTASNGAEAWAILCEEPYRMVISDWNMPGMSGVTLCRKIREAGLPHHVYVILLTTWKRELDIIEGLAAGADDILTKPFNVLELRVRICNASRILNLEELVAANLQLSDARSVLQKQNLRLQKLYGMAQVFVDNVSHEFRTPLTVIKEYASLIAEGAVGAVTPEQHSFLQVIENRADDLNTMVNDMLDGSRLDSGMVSVVRHNAPINDIVQRVRPMLDRKAAVKGLDLTFQLADSLPPVYVDEEKIGRVLINLAVNAIKFCGEPGKICIWTKPDDRGGVLVGVTDNGPGIPEDRQREIFRRFSQLGTDVRESTMGFGLGLSIAKELVDLNLGELGLVSAPGTGSTFQFTLPPAEPLTVLERYLVRITEIPGGVMTVSLISAAIPIDESSAAAEVEDFLAHLLRCNDLMFQTDSHRWLLLTPLSELEEHRMLERLQSSLRDANLNRPNRSLPEVVLERIATCSVLDDRETITQHFRRAFEPAMESVAAV